jgi:hypothetical protein
MKEQMMSPGGSPSSAAPPDLENISSDISSRVLPSGKTPIRWATFNNASASTSLVCGAAALSGEAAVASKEDFMSLATVLTEAAAVDVFSSDRCSAVMALEVTHFRRCACRALLVLGEREHQIDPPAGISLAIGPGAHDGSRRKHRLEKPLPSEPFLGGLSKACVEGARREISARI